MRISAKTEYACLAVIDLAAAYETGEPMRAREIAERHGIPSRFLVQILLQLKAAGTVTSTRGAAGGYQLARPPAQVTLAEVMAVVEGAEDQLRSSASVRTPESDILLSTWQEVCDTEQAMLERVTFADLAEQTRSHDENMFYI